MAEAEAAAEAAEVAEVAQPAAGSTNDVAPRVAATSVSAEVPPSLTAIEAPIEIAAAAPSVPRVAEEVRAEAIPEQKEEETIIATDLTSAVATMSPSATACSAEHSAPPNAESFVGRLLSDDDDAIRALCAGCAPEDSTQSAREQLAASLALDGPADPSLNIGTDEAAQVVAHFCMHHGADTRTSRTMIDVLLLLQPTPSPCDLWLCLAALVRRFAPVALLPGAGHAILYLCRLFESLLLFHDPEIALLLKRAGVSAELYCLPWLCTAHATGMADLMTVLHVWDRWADGGEPLDPVFLGLARLSLCRDELLLCGPVPELAQLLHTSLGTKQHATERVADAALRRAADLKSVTPLSFLKRLQDALLRPTPEAPAAAKAPAPEAPLAGAAGPSASGGYPRAEAKVEEQTKKGPAWAKNIGQRASGWLRRAGDGAAPLPAKASTPPGRPAVEPIACMKVEAQDVMMLETVKERHFDRVREEVARRSSAEVDESADGGGTSPSHKDAVVAAPDSGSDVCRLVPRLIDLRNTGEVHRLGIKGVKAVDVTKRSCAADFVQWSTQKKIDFSNYGLMPMHVLLTSVGTMNADQESFLKTVLMSHVAGLCVLSGGYASLEPFFISGGPDGAGTGGGPGFDTQAAQAALAAGAQDAQKLLHKGVTGLQLLWEKAPSRKELKERLAVAQGKNESSLGETFERAPLPPLEALLAAGTVAPAQLEDAASLSGPAASASAPAAEAEASQTGET